MAARGLHQPSFPGRFFVLAFGISWGLWLPGILGGPALTPLAVFGPSLAAFWLMFRQDGWPGVKKLLGRALVWRIGGKWLELIFLIPAAIVSLSAAVMRFSGEEASTIGLRIPEFLPNPVLLLPFFIFTLIFQGPVGEEFGWRGFALDRLQKIWGPRKASVVLGIFWGLWHLPLFFIPGEPHAEALPLLPFLFSTIPLSIIITWIYNHTARNLLTALLLHQTVNFSLVLNPWIQQTTAAFTTMVILYTIFAGVLLTQMGSDSVNTESEQSDDPSGAAH